MCERCVFVYDSKGALIVKNSQNIVAMFEMVRNG